MNVVSWGFKVEGFFGKALEVITVIVTSITIEKTLLTLKNEKTWRFSFSQKVHQTFLLMNV
jgi:hypothetical protein